MKILTMLLLLPIFCTAKEIEFKGSLFTKKVDMSKLVVFDYKAFIKNKVRIQKDGYEYHLLQDVNFQVPETKGLIETAYLITDGGTYELRLKEVKLKQKTVEIDQELSTTDFYNHVYVSKTKLQFDKVAFFSFHKFKLENIELFDDKKKPKGFGISDKLISDKWLAFSAWDSQLKVKFKRLADGKVSYSSMHERNRHDLKIPTTELKINNSECLEWAFSDISYIDCVNNDSIKILTDSEVLIDLIGIHGHPYYKPLFMAFIDGTKYYFVSDSPTVFYKRDGKWIRPDKFRMWYPIEDEII